MKDLRRISGLAIFLLVVLRLAIGWQFLYEGLWKWETRSGPNPWTSRGFLANAQGPMRGVFRSMTGDPDDLDWLGYEEIGNEKVPNVQMQWGDWLNTFANHYDLDDRQFARLSATVRGPEYVTSDPFDMPEDVKLTGRFEKLLEYDTESRRLKLQTAVFDDQNYWHPRYHLIPADRKALMKLVPDVTEVSEGVFESEADDDSHVGFAQGVHTLYERQANLSYFERLRAIVLGDPELVTIVNDDPEYAGSVDATRIGKIDQYRRRLEQYESQLKNADITFHRSHLEYEWKELQTMKADLIGPIKQLETDMKKEAYDSLTAAQRELGPPPLPWTPQDYADWTAIWALLVLGGMLMLGFGARIAAFLAAGMLLTFYMVWPPFPGVPEAPGPEHALIVNKNLIEAIALFAIAAMPTGTWFGLDGLFAGCCRRKPKRKDSRARAAAAIPESAVPDKNKPNAETISGTATPEAIKRLSRAADGKSADDTETKKT